ncbi:MAG TPA: glycosyltransferase family 2 protein [Vicinamibacterales bacterium]|nr:glycosyltransferase family 2 protein [Vicinamibacterales bacterium]
MTVAVVIVNWNAGDLLRRCLESLERQTRRPDKVVIVDNGSSDESLNSARHAIQALHTRLGAELIRLPENAGFARANNIAARAAGQVDAFALLNPDAFPEPAWLEALVAAAERHPDVAAFASQMRLDASPDRLDGAGDSYHVSGRAWRIGHRVSCTEWPAADAEVFAPCAAAALYRREAFEEVGGFDEQFFCYFEDVDLGFRLRLRGHRCLYVHSAVVRHVSSASSGYRSDFAVYHGERNAVWTFVKNMPAPLFWVYLPQHLALNLAALLFYPMRAQGKAVWRAKIDALRGLPAVWRRRKRVQAVLHVDPWALRRSMRVGIAVPYLRRYSDSRR